VPRSASVTVTVALASAAPEGSLTVPVIAPVACCARATCETISIIVASMMTVHVQGRVRGCRLLHVICIVPPFKFFVKLSAFPLFLSLAGWLVQFTTVAAALWLGSLQDRTFLVSIICCFSSNVSARRLQPECGPGAPPRD